MHRKMLGLLLPVALACGLGAPDRGDCPAYIACSEDIGLPSSTLEVTYGAEGQCWDESSEDLCRAECADALETLSAEYPGCVATPAADDDTAGDSEQPVGPDMSRYQADLVWTYDTWGDSYDCVDKSRESAEEITTGHESYAGLRTACPECDHFYAVSYDNDVLCDWIEIPNPDYRGIALGSDDARVYRFDSSGSSFEVMTLTEAAAWDGRSLEFEAEFPAFADLFVEFDATFQEL